MTKLTECRGWDEQEEPMGAQYAVVDRFIMWALILFLIGVGFLAGRCSAPTLRPAVVAMEPAPDFSGKGPEL